MGFVKAKSKASLIAGTVSAVLIGGCYVLALSKPAAGFVGAFVVATILDGIFAVRLLKTKKFMPSGMLLILCIVCQVLSIMAVMQLSGH